MHADFEGSLPSAASRGARIDAIADEVDEVNAACACLLDTL